MRAIKFTFAGDVKASDTMYSVLFWSAVALLAAWIFFVVFEMVKGLYPVQQLPRVPDEARHDQDKERGKSQHSDPPFLRNPVGADRGDKGVRHVN